MENKIHNPPLTLKEMLEASSKGFEVGSKDFEVLSFEELFKYFRNDMIGRAEYCMNLAFVMRQEGYKKGKF